MGITIAARSACILAAITQWPTAVPSVTTIRLNSSSRNEIRPVDPRRENTKSIGELDQRRNQIYLQQPTTDSRLPLQFRLHLVSRKTSIHQTLPVPPPR